VSTTRPTLEDVARHAGVSRALVSIIVRGAPGASEATRERVLRSAAQLGYRPNTMARRLSSHHTGTVGVVFSLGRTFHTELVEHLYAASADLELVLSAVTRGRSEQVALEAVLDQRPEAVIVVGGSLSGDELARAAGPTPVAVALREVRHDRVDSVRTDEAAGIRAALAHLRELGHRHVAHVDGGSAPGARARRRAYGGFLDDDPAMGPARLLHGGMTEEDGLRAATELLSEGLGDTTAIIVFNDRSALSLLDQLRHADVAVPQRISVVGFDDIRASALEHVSLTTVRQDGSAIADSLMGALRRRLAEPEVAPQRVVIPPALVVRSTTAPPPVVG
jgi:DNA-binding LacI/PurR family transcriptional regulator